MEYRNIAGYKASLLGFGCMRLPTLNGNIDEKKALRMIDKAFHVGVNYFDTAFPYHGGKSEPFMGKALSAYPRKTFHLATKLPCWKVDSVETAEKIFSEQLKRLQTDYVDFYLLHSLSRKTWNAMVKLGVLEFCDKLKAEGKIRRFGFSFHDKYEVFEEIITYRKWDFCQLQLNYMDADEQAGVKGCQLAENLSVPVVVMEPVKGGLLASLPPDIEAVFKSIRPESSVASWALRWAASLSNVSVVLSGMSSAEQVEDNLKTLGKFSPLSVAELAAVEKAADMLKSRVNNGCTDCKYCMPCPSGVNIPLNFSVWNSYGMYKNAASAAARWRGVEEAQKAANCVSCGKCEKACPQKISIIKDLAALQAELDSLGKKA